MAENQLKRIDSLDFGEDDPFAELKEIMGFDRPKPVESPVEAAQAEAPTQPGLETPRAAHPAERQAAMPVAEDDFAIDLEQELIAGFGAEFGELATPPVQAYAAPATEPVRPVAPRAVEPVAEPVRAETAAAAAEPVAPAREPVISKPFSGWIFSKATPAPAAKPAPKAASLAPVVAAPIIAAPAIDRDREIEDEIAAALGSPETDFDAAFAAEFETAPAQGAVAHAPVSQPQPAPAHQPEPATVFQPKAEPEAFDTFDLGDDFAAAFEQESIEAAAPEPVYATAAPAPAAQPEPDALAEFEELDFGDDLAAELAVREPEIRTPVETEPPLELEFDHDELMRDLGDIGGDEQPAEAASAPLAADVQADIDFNFDVAMADVDMEFDDFDDDAGPVAASPESAMAAETPVGAEPVMAAAEPAMEEFDSLTFDDLSFDEPVMEEPVIEEPVIEEPVKHEPSAYARAMAQAYQPAEASPEPEMSFEDELKALLGTPIEPAVLQSDYVQPPLPEPTPIEAYVLPETSFDNAPEWEAGSDFDFALDEADLAPEETHATSQHYAEVPAYQPEALAEPVAAAGFDAEFDTALSGYYAPDSTAYVEPEPVTGDAAAIEDHDAFAYADEGYAPAYAPAAQAQVYAAPHDAYAAAPRYEAGARTHVPAMPPLDDEAPAFDDHAFDAAFETALAGNDGDDFELDLDEPAELAPAPSATVRAVAAHARHDAPEVDTVDVPEAAVALAEDLDIPELNAEDDVRAAPAFDDFEPDFSDIFKDMAPQPAAGARAMPAAHQPARGDHNDYAYESALATTAAATAAINAEARRSPMPEWEEEFIEPDQQAVDPRFGDRRQMMQEAPHFDDFGDEFDGPSEADDSGDYEQPAPARRGMLIAAVVGGVALLGVAGAFALTFGGGDSATSGPAVVRADPEPIKVKPENPGGTTVPGADNKVFETMAGATDPVPPVQETLNASSEEPIDIDAPAAEPEMALTPFAADPAAKGEDRIAPDETGERSADAMEVAAVAPRRVKTVVVRSDGTLAPREEPVAAPVEAKPSALAPARPAAEETAPAEAAVAPEPVVEQPATAETAAAPEAESVTPETGPVATARPAEQPVDIVGEVAPERVATVAPAGGWSVQIASQPSEAAAQSTYADLSRRYAGVLGGKDASIVKAEIAGKGTFWRVRIAANSRNDAINLCENYKAAGGSCFVSK